ncbi:MAG: hypothetical protein BYD32DRAFT_230608 [Podila humilis]|nr:MAG: hypothetical protein BYD32DRAFT_230608 [Podila humilis]
MRRGKGAKRGEGVVTAHHCPAQLVYCTENDEDILLAPSLWIRCQQQLWMGVPSLVIHNCLSSTVRTARKQTRMPTHAHSCHVAAPSSPSMVTKAPRVTTVSIRDGPSPRSRQKRKSKQGDGSSRPKGSMAITTYQQQADRQKKTIARQKKKGRYTTPLSFFFFLLLPSSSLPTPHSLSSPTCVPSVQPLHSLISYLPIATHPFAPFHSLLLAGAL